MKNMIYQKPTFLAFAFLVGATITNAGGSHGEHSHEGVSHAEKVVAPNGGRLVDSVESQVEFFLTADRFVQITFLGHDGKVVPVDEQVITLIGGDRSSPTMLSFVEKDGVLLSTAALPDIKNMPIVLQIKVSPDAKIVREKFYLNLSNCGSCSFKEYACICGH